MALTISVVDNLTGTVTGTIAGGVTGNLLRWYTAKLDGSFVAGSWTFLASDNAPLAFPLVISGAIIPAGYGLYFSYATDLTAGLVAEPFFHTFRDPNTLLPVVERIAVALLARLGTITIAAGYQQTVTGVLRAKSGAGITPGHLKVIVIQKDAEKADDYSFPGNPPAQGWLQPFEVNLLIRPSDGSTTADDETLGKFYADAVKAITTPQSTWHNWGNLAVNSEWQATTSSITEAAQHVIRALTLNVHYRTSENDPYTAR